MKGDEVKLEIGGDVLTVTPLTIGEISDWNLDQAKGIPCDDKLDGYIRNHVKTPDGKPLDVRALTIPQLRQLVNALVGIPKESPIADCVGMMIGGEE